MKQEGEKLKNLHLHNFSLTTKKQINMNLNQFTTKSQEAIQKSATNRNGIWQSKY